MLVIPEDGEITRDYLTSVVTQRQLIPCEVDIDTLRFALEALFEGMHTVRTLRMPKKSDKNDANDNENYDKFKKKSPTKGRKTKAKTTEVVIKKEEEEEEEGVSIDNGAVTRKAGKSDEVGVEHVILEWASDPFADVLADATLRSFYTNREPETLKGYERDHALR